MTSCISSRTRVFSQLTRSLIQRLYKLLYSHKKVWITQKQGLTQSHPKFNLENLRITLFSQIRYSWYVKKTRPKLLGLLF